MASFAVNRLVLPAQWEACAGMIEASDRADIPARLGVTLFARTAKGTVCKLAAMGVPMAVRTVIKMLQTDVARRELRLGRG